MRCVEGKHFRREHLMQNQPPDDLIEHKPGTQEQIMTRQQRIGAFAATMLLLLGSAGAALAVDLNLTPSVVGFHNPIGIDFQDISGKLILTAELPHWSAGQPRTG